MAGNIAKWENCGATCQILTTTKEKNVRMDRFWCCPQSTRMDNCGYGIFEWIEQVREIVSNQETGQCSQGLATNTATASRSSVYLKGYLSGVVSGYRNATKILDELVDAVDKLDLE